MHSTHQKGLYGEIAFTLRLLKKGFTVLQPVNPNSSYDLVIEKDSNFQRIQVKYLSATHDRFRVELERPKKHVSYRDRGVDALGIFESTQEKYYLIPISAITSKSDFWLRIGKPKNNQVRGIHFAQEFEI